MTNRAQAGVLRVEEAKMRDARRHHGRPVRILIVSLLLVLPAACAGGPGDAGEPSVQQLPVDSLELAPGQDVRVQRLRLTFLDVAEDSRCPIDAICIWQGNAAVRIALGAGPRASQAFVLQTADGTPTVDFAGYRVTLLALLPAPRAGVRIPPAAYRAILRVDAAD